MNTPTTPTLAVSRTHRLLRSIILFMYCPHCDDRSSVRLDMRSRLIRDRKQPQIDAKKKMNTRKVTRAIAVAVHCKRWTLRHVWWRRRGQLVTVVVTFVLTRPRATWDFFCFLFLCLLLVVLVGRAHARPIEPSKKGLRLSTLTSLVVNRRSVAYLASASPPTLLPASHARVDAETLCGVLLSNLSALGAGNGSPPTTPRVGLIF